MSTAYDLLTNGSVIDAVNSLYDGATGDWWKIIIYVVTILGIYVVTKHEGTTAAACILLTAFLSYHFGSAVPVYIHGVIYVICALTLTALIFRAVGKGE